MWLFELEVLSSVWCSFGFVTDVCILCWIRNDLRWMWNVHLSQTRTFWRARRPLRYFFYLLRVLLEVKEGQEASWVHIRKRITFTESLKKENTKCQIFYNWVITHIYYWVTVMKSLSNNSVEFSDRVSGILTLSDFNLHIWRGRSMSVVMGVQTSECVFREWRCMYMFPPCHAWPLLRVVLTVRGEDMAFFIKIWNGIKKAACPVPAPAETRSVFRLQPFCTCTGVRKKTLLSSGCAAESFLSQQRVHLLFIVEGVLPVSVLPPGLILDTAERQRFSFAWDTFHTSCPKLMR